MGLPGPELDEDYRERIRRIQPGGFILFARNIETPTQLRALTHELRALCDIPPIIMVDQEGGRVSRLEKITARPPYADELRRAARADLIEWHGRLMAKVLSAFGFTLNLAPVVDILLDPKLDNSLSGRCLGATPDEVVQNAAIWMRSHREHGVGVTIKHFPGYSLCANDPHGGLPVLNRTLDEMMGCELYPFRKLAPLADVVMVGHALYPELAKDKLPSSLSREIIRNLLRGQLGFQKLVMTDDLEMGAVSSQFSPAELTINAINAGNDLLLFCHDWEMVEFAIMTIHEDLQPQDWLPAVERVLAWKRQAPKPPYDPLKLDPTELTREIRELADKTLSALKQRGEDPFS